MILNRRLLRIIGVAFICILCGGWAFSEMRRMAEAQLAEVAARRAEAFQAEALRTAQARNAQDQAAAHALQDIFNPNPEPLGEHTHVTPASAPAAATPPAATDESLPLWAKSVVTIAKVKRQQPAMRIQ
ncbi:MAG: hypothetical protein JSS02_04490, partial [Planctomycetes bacterium]|nr:hypothetical protein [Planctomycetota bacterium]